MSDTARKGRSGRRFTVDSLFKDSRPEATGLTDLVNAKEINLDRIEADPNQPRQTFDPERLEELARSIRQEGVLQPIVVRYDEPRDVYIIVHGERRWRAATLAGKTSIPALVRDVPAERRLIQQLVENVVRDDLNAIDRAAALRALRAQLGNAPWEQVAEAVGIKRSRLFQLLGTEKLPQAAQDDIQQGRLSEKQTRALQGLDGPQQEALRAVMVEHNMPAPVAQRLAKVVKAQRYPAGIDAEGIRADVVRLSALVAPKDAADQRAQTIAVLDAIRTETGKEMAAMLATPAYREDRLVREVGQLARSLTRVTRGQLRQEPDMAESLRKLRDALDTILP